MDRAWYFVRDTPGVIGFAGPKDRPVPMRDSEVESLLAQMREREDTGRSRRSAFEVGETVKVADGPFQNQSGVVEEIDPARGKLRVSRHHLRAHRPGGTGILAGRARLDRSPAHFHKQFRQKYYG